MESFKPFSDRYQQFSEIQQQQILEAFTTAIDPASQARFHEWWKAFEVEAQRLEAEALEKQISAVQVKLETCLVVLDYRQVVQKYGQWVVDSASERLLGHAKETVERLAKFIQKNGF
jgi:hypothetical protein